MSDTERRTNRPIEETDKVILAAFNRFKEKRAEATDILSSLDIYDNGVKVVKLSWIKFDGSQNIMRAIDVRILEGHLEVWAYINGLIDLATYKRGIKRELVGIERLPIFTSGLEDIIEDAYDIAKDWSVRDLMDPKSCLSLGSIRCSVGSAPEIPVKDFID